MTIFGIDISAIDTPHAEGTGAEGEHAAGQAISALDSIGAAPGETFCKEEVMRARDNSRKLSLHKETIRRLNGTDLQQAAGGATATCAAACNTTNCVTQGPLCSGNCVTLDNCQNTATACIG